MKKILAYITPEKQAGFFDLVVGYDSDADVIVPYTNLEVSDVKDVIYGAVFTRHPKDLKNTAIFIGGHDFAKCLELMDEAKRVFKTLPEKFRVSLALDPDGACTTASSCVAKIKSSLKNLSGKKVVILAGTGPVGQSVAVFLSREEKAKVTITSRKLEKAKKITRKLRKRYGVRVAPLQGSNSQEIAAAVKDADIVISTGPEGVVMLSKKIWKNSEIEILADVNAVPPAGIEGVVPGDDGVNRNGKICFGAIGIGNLKIKVHHELIKRLFLSQEIFDLKNIYQLTLKLAK